MEKKNKTKLNATAKSIEDHINFQIVPNPNMFQLALSLRAVVVSRDGVILIVEFMRLVAVLQLLNSNP